MKQPLFSVGENVQLKSTDGKFQGEYQVVLVVEPKADFMDRLKSVKRSNKSKDVFGYLLSKSFRSEKGYEILWAEHCLRKIHKPSEFSFDQLISEIKCPYSIKAYV